MNIVSKSNVSNLDTEKQHEFFDRFQLLNDENKILMINYLENLRETQDMIAPFLDSLEIID